MQGTHAEGLPFPHTMCVSRPACTQRPCSPSLCAHAPHHPGNNAPGKGAPVASSYDRPWRKGMAPGEAPAGPGGGRQGGPNGAPGSSDGPKKKYVGPDPDLAVQLERDMMDGNPNIRWG